MPDRPAATAHPAILALVATGGAAALAWEVIWQIRTSLALGVSALGAAITLAAMMGGMTAGALAAGALLARRTPDRPLRVYGAVEAAIGLSALMLLSAFMPLERVDAAAWRVAPALAPIVHAAAIVLVIGLPTVLMGWTGPLLGLVARRHGMTLAAVYAANVAGAAIGVLLVALIVMPFLGVTYTACAVASLEILAGTGAWFLGARPAAGRTGVDGPAARNVAFVVPPRIAVLVAFSTGFVTFALEVAWFRSLRAAFQSTTQTFAIVLAAVLVPLAYASRLVPPLRRNGRVGPGPLLVAAGVAVLLATPLLERVDRVPLPAGWPWAFVGVWRFLLAFGCVAPSMVLLGTTFPWLLDERAEPGAWGRLYATNTVGAIAGAVVAAWLGLPTLGFARTSWVAGGVLVTAGALTLHTARGRGVGVLAGGLALAVAVTTESGLGRLRVQSSLPTSRVLASEEGPDATVSALRTPDGARHLVIDGFFAAGDRGTAHYMEWMGRLPMLAHPAPRRALVIGFGIGHTANGVRREGTVELAIDIAELSPAVLRLAPFFPSNEAVLDDRRVRAIVMDGRAWLRRSEERYDVVALEPMAPFFAASNALYSRELYELIGARLAADGVVAQWVPMHLLSPFDAASVVRTFIDVFPDAVLWIDPRSGTGIVLGRRGQGTDGTRSGPPAWTWPGLARPVGERDLTNAEIVAALKLDVAAVRRFAANGTVITDDNQLLAYGESTHSWYDRGPDRSQALNLAAVERAARE
jgi:spermidine synthase